MREPTMRDLTKAYMVQERSHCDWPDCKHPADRCDMHEIVSRGRTVNNDLARALSFYPQLAALLCQVHHAQASGAEAMLLEQNIERYGLKLVCDMYVGILNVLKIDRLGLVLPEAMELAIYGSGDQRPGVDPVAVLD